MPEICRFYNMILSMNFNDHNPPHIHIRFNDLDSAILIASGEILVGSLPKKQLLLVQAWIEMNRNALVFMWNNRYVEGTVFQLPPL